MEWGGAKVRRRCGGGKEGGTACEYKIPQRI